MQSFYVVPIHPLLYSIVLYPTRAIKVKDFLVSNGQYRYSFSQRLWEKKHKVKVKCNLVQAVRLCTDPMTNSGSRGVVLLFLDHGTRRWWGVSVTPRPLFIPGKDPVTIVQKAWWAPGRSGQVRKISTLPGFNPRTVHPVARRYTRTDTY